VSTYVRSPFSPLAAEADCLGHSSDSELNCEGRLVVTDHGAFVLFNVYVPNAGDHPQRPRLGFKMSFLEALRDKMQQYMGQGRQVG
jgi:exonuclease III